MRNRCRARRVALRVLSNFYGLTANDSTTALIIDVVTSVGQSQRDL
ncbi:hypothetical protein HII36_22410 [Nonomuraea sp. NN258]|nr:hypothetical protein [Nonomuraea antri]NRQ34570.1 hypothetical protein [Nonomuraea antri]